MDRLREDLLIDNNFHFQTQMDRLLGINRKKYNY